jgi:hypothetical protein
MDRLSRPKASHTRQRYPVAFQHLLPQTAEVFFVPLFERLADSTHSMREDLRSSASAMHRVLFGLRHHIARSVLSRTATSISHP